jgi:hypothetical protein
MNIGKVRSSNGFMRTVASVVLVTFSTVTISPGAQAIAQTIEAAAEIPLAIEAAEQPHDDKLEHLKSALSQLRVRAERREALLEEKAALHRLRSELKTLDTEALEEFDQVEAHLKQRKLPEAILQRHREALEKFKQTAAATHENLADIDATADAAAVATKSAALRQRLEGTQTKRRHQPFDPKNLPFRAPSNNVRPPKMTPEEFAALVAPKPVDGVRLAAAHPLSFLPMMQASSTLPGPEYLAATEDVQITQPIRDLAAQLHNNPVEIYNWVRNNINSLPTYGSIQGSDLTLQTKQGNAADTSSLLIALLRASNIPARYAHGTVEVPVDKVMNWVGGVTSPQAALDLLAQGGIPIIGLAQGGTIRAAHLEHVWVEAFVDFVPSRGAKNRVGDTWVPMDASFKKYVYTEGMPLSDGVGYSSEQLLSDMRQNATLNPQEGWSSGLNHQFVTNKILQYQQTAEAFVTAIDNDATVAEILGAKSIVPQNHAVLAASLPYKIVAEGLRVAALPDSLRARLQVDFFANPFDQQTDSPSFTWSASLPMLAGKRITVAYDPATADDRALLDSYAASSSPIPAYLVQVQPVLRVDGEPVARGGSAIMGSDQAWNLHVRAPNTDVLSARNSIVAGTYAAVVPKLTTIMPQQFAAIEERSQQALSRLQNGQSDLVATDAIVGEFLNVAGLGYWAQQDLIGRLMARAQKIQKVNRFAVGIFAWEPSVEYSYGMPRRAVAGGLSTDIDINLTSMMSSDGRPDRVAIARMMEGQLSSHLEGSHWAIARNRRDNPNSGFSSSQIFQHLSAQGARIYAINGENVNAMLASLPIAESVKADIRAGVNAGLVAYVNDRPAAIGGWTGSGYVILDPQTGAGAYRISGGLNGGGEACQCFNVSLTQELLLVLGVTVVGVKAPVGGAVLATVLAVALALNSLCQIDENPCLTEEGKEALRVLVYLSFFFSGVGAAIGIAGLFLGPGALVIAAVLGMFMNYLSIALSAIASQLSSGALNRCRQ